MYSCIVIIALPNVINPARHITIFRSYTFKRQCSCYSTKIHTWLTERFWGWEEKYRRANSRGSRDVSNL